jgi:NAD(P)-dependent dehydrogenase (short-subunit alcohol dehydrogenase family)
MSDVLRGKVAVITGGTRGLGLAIARAFAAEGAAVVLSGRSSQAVEAAVAELTTSGSALVSGVRCDVSDPGQVQTLAAFTLQKHGRFDVWVNNAGVTAPFGPTFATSPAEFENILRTNVLGVYYGSRAALEHFLPRRAGKLINLLGRGARSPAPLQNPYGASKAWVTSFTAALAKEYAGRGVGIFALAPGMMRTDMLLRPTAFVGYAEQLGGAFQTVLRMWSQPPEAAARRTVWLASAATDGKTGLTAQAMGPAAMLAGSLRELIRRLTGKAETLDVQVVSVEPEPFGESPVQLTK